MPTKLTITSIHARELLDSRGNPTVEVDVVLQGGSLGRAMVPSGASTGAHEAVELRDNDPARYGGKGVRQAVANVNQVIAPAILKLQLEATEQQRLDEFLCELDGTADKSSLGANALLGVSLATARAAAAARRMPLYHYLGGGAAADLPVPMINIISGGQHGGWNLDFQDFMVIPVGATSYSEALVRCGRVYRSMYQLLSQRRLAPHGVADEGGFGPRLESNEAALILLTEAIELAGYRAGRDRDMAIAIDVAATEFYEDGQYRLRSEHRSLGTDELVAMLHRWVQDYPVLSIEDGLAEDDWDGWQQLTQAVGDQVQLIGDDLFTTNMARLKQGIEQGVANAVLIKLNQIGTLTETLQVVAVTQRAGYLPVISARSGETEDTTIADLAVATAAGQIKVGSLARSERLAKYNQLLRIEEELGPRAEYRGRRIFQRFF